MFYQLQTGVLSFYSGKSFRFQSDIFKCKIILGQNHTGLKWPQTSGNGEMVQTIQEEYY